MRKGSNTGKRAGFAAKAAAVAFASCLTVGCVGAGFLAVASPSAATGSEEVAATEEPQATTQSSQAEEDINLLTTGMQEASVLEVSTDFDISATVETIEAKKEAERRAAEEKRIREEKEHIAQAQQNIATWKAKVAADAGAGAISGLSSVDWSVGKEKFLETWTERIDNYLAGSPLSGHGSTFAEAAWEYGVDPRWSPAISNTESTKGANCFKSCNAWGWGQSSWGSWDEAIWAHVKGLASRYGYSITYNFAYIYCPPNYNNWFYDTIGQMKKI